MKTILTSSVASFAFLSSACAIVNAIPGSPFLFDPDDVTTLLNGGNGFAVASGSTLEFNTDDLSVTFNASPIGTGEQGIAGDGSGDQFAIFAFSSLDIASGVSITLIGSRPIAILSQNSFSLGSPISANGRIGEDSSFSDPFRGVGGPGGGEGGIGGSRSFVSTPGAPGVGGGGSGGAGGRSAGGTGGGGGGGGGSITFIAQNTLTLSSALSASGGEGGEGSDGGLAGLGGGGGGGGSLSFAAPTLILEASSSFNVSGGAGGEGFFPIDQNNPTGGGPSGDGADGANGAIAFFSDTVAGSGASGLPSPNSLPSQLNAVPEPTSAILALLGTALLLRRNRRTQRGE